MATVNSLSTTQMDTLSVMLRHQDALGGALKKDNLQQKLDDPATDPDLRTAIQGLLNDQDLFKLLDTKRKKGEDGKLSMDDVRSVVDDSPELRAHMTQKAEMGTHAYIPSDAPQDQALPRQMTTNDALRELYLYSDSLPKKITPDTLLDIVEGSAKGKKLPPQVAAAAKHLLDHPRDMFEVLGPHGAKKADFCNRVANEMRFTTQEMDTLKALEKDADVFFKDGNLTREKLDKMLADPAVSEEHKKICQALKDNGVLFGLLDNAKKGHAGGGFFSKAKADDGQISKDDLKALMKRMTVENLTPPEAPRPPSLKGDAAVAVVKEMLAGRDDDPDVKTPKGDGRFFKVMAKVMEAVSYIADAASAALGALAKIPGLGLLAAAGSVVLGTVGGALRVGKTALEGGDVDKALKDMGMDAAAAALGAVLAPGAGKAILTVAKEGAEAAVEAGVKAGAREAAGAAATQAAGEGAEAATAAAAKAAANEATEAAAMAAVKTGAGEGAEATAAKSVQTQLADLAMGGADDVAETMTKREALQVTRQAAVEEARSQVTAQVMELTGLDDAIADLEERALEQAPPWVKKAVEISKDPKGFAQAYMMAQLPPQALQALAVAQDPKGAALAHLSQHLPPQAMAALQAAQDPKGAAFGHLQAMQPQEGLAALALASDPLKAAQAFLQSKMSPQQMALMNGADGFQGVIEAMVQNPPAKPMGRPAPRPVAPPVEPVPRPMADARVPAAVIPLSTVNNSLVDLPEDQRATAIS